MTTEATPVVFRFLNAGKGKYWQRDLIALFPGETWTDRNRGKLCSSYIHIGQHCGADYAGIIKSSRPATPDEYASLKRELESSPYNYNLKVLKRWTSRRS